MTGVPSGASLRITNQTMVKGDSILDEEDETLVHGGVLVGPAKRPDA
jgi:hypothetical protein